MTDRRRAWALAIFLSLLLIGLLYRLWIGEGSLAHVAQLKAEIQKQSAENQRLIERNKILAAEVEALKYKDDAVEARARHDLGMIKEGETFFMVVDPEDDDKEKQ